MASPSDQNPYIGKAPFVGRRRELEEHPWLLQNILRMFWRERSLESAWSRTFDRCHHAFEVWRRQLGEEGLAFIKALGTEGVLEIDFRTDPIRKRQRHLLNRCKHMCLVIEEAGRIQPGPHMFMDWLGASKVHQEPFEFAIGWMKRT